MLNIKNQSPPNDMGKSFYITIYNLLKEIKDSYANTFYRIMNPGEEPLNEDERLLLTNPEDREKYIKALENLKKAREDGKIQPKETIILSNGESVTITTAS
ncbi:hypothetical protein SMI01S_12140 [Sphingobacterium mizutaii NBRC 14946 = DSM 11724]|uniref:Uncharacterized protein n=2 Tax=Sphingobacterium mizutaii TaxID=1010 RepID=A0AAJ4XCL0_9SPHI|nr:hypothetical protein [Sphingobacterium mizutaii]GEM67608.1 hypothetical protein SMI01S_12140 [Sphingobacterium mizutaii NBRC 14946 = DSM 11724]SDL15205.1 hypothetical protein SAMN05192578_1011548 [Sphingobacterium mizutaii]SNV52334.1 Uncharacterised protein [Sphingobacterium mizutaii]